MPAARRRVPGDQRRHVRRSARQPGADVLLGTGGLGLGLQFSTLISHLTTTVPGDYAPDSSGVATTAMQIGGALSVAAIGTLYLSLADHPGAGPVIHAYAITTVLLGAVALIAILTARLATRRTAA